jgi:hypothetical protein
MFLDIYLHIFICFVCYRKPEKFIIWWMENESGMLLLLQSVFESSFNTVDLFCIHQTSFELICLIGWKGYRLCFKYVNNSFIAKCCSDWYNNVKYQKSMWLVELELLFGLERRGKKCMSLAGCLMHLEMNVIQI